MKRLLATCIAIALFLCLLPAAQANVVFGDDSDIINSDAAAMLTSMGIIQGFPDGKFHPAEDVTRAQLAKMIYYILNGVKDKSEDRSRFYTGTEFSDVNGHWASGYVYYCYRKGIIAGYTDGTFRPDRSVSAYEACKMLLTAAGYEPSRYVGRTWDVNTAEDARLSGISHNYNYPMDSILDRDSAALLIYNALFCETKANGKPSGTTMLQTGYGAQKRTVTVISNETGSLDGSLCSEGYTRVRAADTGETLLLEESSGVDHLGRTYTIYMRSRGGGGIWTLYGNFFSSRDNKTLTDTSPELGFGDVVGKGKAFTALAENASFFVNYFTGVDQLSFLTILSAHPDWKVIYISNDGDDLLDYAIVLNTWVCRIELSGPGGGVRLSGHSTSIPPESIVYDGSLIDGNFYTVTKVDSKYLFEDAISFTASVSSFRSGKSVTVGAAEYMLSTAVCYMSSGTGDFISASSLASGEYTGRAMTFVLDSNGHVAGAYLDGGKNSGFALLLGSSYSPYKPESAGQPASSQTVSLALPGKTGADEYRVILSGGDLHPLAANAMEPGLYSYSAINGDGTVYGLERAGTQAERGTAIEIINGSRTVAGLPYPADENTVFFFWTGIEGDTPVSYRGIYAVPTSNLTVSDKAGVWYYVRNNVIAAVYAAVADPGTTGGNGYVYIFNPVPEVTPQGGGTGSGAYFYTYEGYSGGLKIRLRTTQKSIRPGLFAFTTSGDASTLYMMGSSNCVKTKISDIYSGFIYLSGNTSPGSIHNWAESEIYRIDTKARTMVPTDSLETNTDVIIVYNRTSEYSADAAYIFIGNGVDFGVLNS